MTDTEDERFVNFGNVDGYQIWCGKLDYAFNIDREVDRWHQDMKYNSALAEVNRQVADELWNAWHNTKGF
ncbi:MAG: hypothetical protein KJ955_08160 [Nanoarchaeota archaeon]|nr:hypothetical protein [Nanoarchaeota archaeon]